MTAVHPEWESAQAIGHTGVICLVTALALGAALALSSMLMVGGVRPSRPPVVAAPPAALDASRFVFDASDPVVGRPSIFAACEALCPFRGCATNSLWQSSSLPPGFPSSSTGLCSVTAYFPRQ